MVACPLSKSLWFSCRIVWKRCAVMWACPSGLPLAAASENSAASDKGSMIDINPDRRWASGQWGNGAALCFHGQFGGW